MTVFWLFIITPFFAKVVTLPGFDRMEISFPDAYVFFQIWTSRTHD